MSPLSGTAPLASMCTGSDICYILNPSHLGSGLSKLSARSSRSHSLPRPQRHGGRPTLTFPKPRRADIVQVPHLMFHLRRTLYSHLYSIPRRRALVPAKTARTNLGRLEPESRQPRNPVCDAAASPHALRQWSAQFPTSEYPCGRVVSAPRYFDPLACCEQCAAHPVDPGCRRRSP